MKTASIILNIVGIVAHGVLWAYSQIWWLDLVGILICLLSIFVTLCSGRKGGGYIFVGIIDILLGSLLGGIFMLCVKEEELK